MGRLAKQDPRVKRLASIPGIGVYSAMILLSEISSALRCDHKCWLLMAQDRVDAGVLPITHDFLAIMLGTDRPSVVWRRLYRKSA